MKAGLIVLGLWLLAGPGQAFSAGLPDGLPTAFDSLGPTVQQLFLTNGRQVHFIDDGADSGCFRVQTYGIVAHVEIKGCFIYEPF